MTTDQRIYDEADDVNAQANAARDTLQLAGKAAAKLADMKAMDVADAIRAGKRAFVFPAHLTYKRLIQFSKPQAVYAGSETPIVAGSSTPGGVEVRRVGDIYIRAVGGICIIDPRTEEGQVQVEWAEAHPEICRDAMLPETEVWAALKTSQQQRSDKEPSLPASLNVDAMLRGESTGFGEVDSIAARARAQLALAGA